MKYKIEIPKIAEKDIFIITDYIYRFSFNKEVAKNTKDILLGAIYSLSLFPNRFEKYNTLYHRMIIKGKYKIIYRIDEKNKKVIIIRIIKTQQEPTI